MAVTEKGIQDKDREDRKRENKPTMEIDMLSEDLEITKDMVTEK